jgi:2-aminobenzoate-CoA ligase
MPLQRLDPDYVPAASDLPLRVFTLPEVRYRPGLNVAEVLLDGARAAGWSDRPAFFFEGRTLSYGDVARDVDRLGNAFIALGIGPGDRVLIRLHDQPELVITILALVKIGAIAVPTYPLLRAPDLVYREHDTEAKALVVGADLLEEAEKARPAFRHVVHRIAVGDAPDGYRSYAGLLAQGHAGLAAAPTRADDIATLIYTSGSTGQAKGVLHSHSDILAAADTYCRFCIRPEADDVLCGPPPIPFSAGLGYFLIFPLRFGAAAILTKDKAPDRMLDAIARHHGTILFAMPTYYNMILKSEGAEVEARVRALRQTLVAGEPVAPELTEQWQARTGHPLAQLLGTTEMFHVFLSPRRGIDEIRPTSMGRAVPGYQVVVRDADSFAEVERGEAGLLTVIGPTGTKYWRKPDEQRRAVRQGWNVCQDLVRMDEDGYLYHLARTDDLIVSAGYNISPVEVESVLLKHPGVVEVAVVGAPDPGGVRSSIVKAFVVARQTHRPGAALARELQQFFREHGTPYMYPREIEFLDQLPKTVTGKIRRSDLRRPTS